MITQRLDVITRWDTRAAIPARASEDGSCYHIYAAYYMQHGAEGTRYGNGQVVRAHTRSGRKTQVRARCLYRYGWTMIMLHTARTRNYRDEKAQIQCFAPSTPRLYKKRPHSATYVGTTGPLRSLRSFLSLKPHICFMSSAVCFCRSSQSCAT